MNRKKRLQLWLPAIGLALLTLALAGCGGSSSGTAPTKTTAAASISTTGGNSGASVLSVAAPAGVTLSIPAGTVFTDISGNPVTGTIATTVGYSPSSSDLPAAASTLPAGTSLVAFADVSLTGATAQVKYFSKPVSLVFAVPSGAGKPGDVLVVYSFDSSTGLWGFAGTEVVDASGNISSPVTHLSIWALFKSAAPPPVAPSGLTAVAGASQASVSWSPAFGAVSYNIYYATASGQERGSNGTKVAGAGSGQAITGLTDGATYYFVVTALNAAGESVVSSEVSAAMIPQKPAGVVVSGADGSATVSWSAVSSATSYNIYYATAIGQETGPNGTKVSGATSGQTVTGLTDGTVYYFVVTAVNAAGESGVSSEKSVTPAALPQAPGSPTGVTVTAGTGQVTVTWGAVGVATSYNVYYLQSAAAPTTATVIGTGTKVNSLGSPLTVTGLATGGSYYFTVTAVNAAGQSGGQTSPKKAVPL